MMKAEPAPTVIFFFLGEDLGLDQRQKGTSSLKEAPQMGQSWENNGKAEADLSSRYFTLLGFEHRNFRSSCMKNEKAGLAVVWVMGEESEGNFVGHAKISKQEQQLFGPATGRALAAMLSARQPATFWEDKDNVDP